MILTYTARGQEELACLSTERYDQLNLKMFNQPLDARSRRIHLSLVGFLLPLRKMLKEDVIYVNVLPC